MSNANLMNAVRTKVMAMVAVVGSIKIQRS